MKIFILFSLILFINSADVQTCLCSNLQTKYDCENAVKFQAASQDLFDLKVCIWNEGQCLDLLKDVVVPCSALDQKYVEIYLHVHGIMAHVRHLPNVQITNLRKGINCLDNGTSCTFDLIGRGEQSCEQIAFEEDCQRMYILYKKTICNWNGSACVGQSLSSCSSLTEKQCLQVNSQCAWKNNSCVKRTCEDGQYSSFVQEGVKLCSSYLDIETDQVMYCEISEDGQCVTSDPEELGRKDCYSQSFQQYTWYPGDQECQKCQS